MLFEKLSHSDILFLKLTKSLYFTEGKVKKVNITLCSLSFVSYLRLRT